MTDYPVASNEDLFYPRKNGCPQCGAQIFEPNSFALLSACTLNGDGQMCEKEYLLDLSLDWHGAHTSMGGKGIYPDLWAHVPIMREIKGGQCELYFCSPTCLKEFLNQAVDELVKRIEENANKD